ncbi:hypothetical protein EJ05DRAFT_337533 [Pseudovirgaria hyperparasitica]|uniref:DUF7730 domain-containing protein n=1 Tax=Pseudovirgaria hyperparasitica TaxID=470096 RepID=A0A6A6W9I9_9PEZI|nr:uncharacterized protein EJ05DRAFT_337533 [Pseudovirgaria hyperparasitica]KAF2759225.1 hypothetical protein EJ05DRAFT_337533 [Pseudovirgaria hyperparasitica]
MPPPKIASNQAEARKTKTECVILPRRNNKPPLLTVPSKPRKQVGFSDLPGEVRNQIYGYYFQKRSRVELHTVPKRTTRKNPLPRKSNQTFIFVSPTADSRKVVYSPKKPSAQSTVHITRPLFKSCHKIRSQYHDTKWSSSIGALFLVSRQLYEETIHFHYVNTTFVFDTSKRLRSFLTHVSTERLSAIRNIEVKHISYGEPQHPRDCVYKNKHDEKWEVLCADTARLMPSLRSLVVSWHVVECPMRFEVTEEWLKPLWAFNVLNKSTTPSELRHLKRSHDIVQDTKILQSAVRESPFKMRVRFSTFADAAHRYQLKKYQIDPRLTAAYDALKGRFEQAIGYVVAGWTMKDAIWVYKEVYRQRHIMWVANLNLNEPLAIFIED